MKLAMKLCEAKKVICGPTSKWADFGKHTILVFQSTSICQSSLIKYTVRYKNYLVTSCGAHSHGLEWLDITYYTKRLVHLPHKCSVYKYIFIPNFILSCNVKFTMLPKVVLTGMGSKDSWVNLLKDSSSRPLKNSRHDIKVNSLSICVVVVFFIWEKKFSGKIKHEILKKIEKNTILSVFNIMWIGFGRNPLRILTGRPKNLINIDELRRPIAPLRPLVI